MALGLMLCLLGGFLVTQSTNTKIGWPMIVVGVMLIIKPAFG